MPERADDLEIFVFTAANAKAQENLLKSIVNQIQPERIVFDSFEEMSEDLHERVRAVFQKSLTFARQTGYLRSRRVKKVVLDTTHVLGRGAVKDNYNSAAQCSKGRRTCPPWRISPCAMPKWTWNLSSRSR